jgi:hypothetical protein
MSKVQVRRFRKNNRLVLVACSLLASLIPFSLPASIIGGDLNSIIGSDLNSIIGGDLSSIAGQDFAVIGSIERIDRRHNLIVVLGQTYSVDQATKISIAGKLLKSETSKSLKLVRAGDYVAVAGAIATNGAVAASKLSVLSATYSDGSSPVYVKGRVTSLEKSIGRLTIGSLVVDYTSSLYAFDANALAVGSPIELAGIRPLANGEVLAFDATASLPDSIIGGDADSIIGGDADSIIGGDANSIIGGDANSIIGGDANSIIGGDVNSIIGGDANSIIGGDANSIIGGDANSIIGGDVNSIIGGDLNSIIGGDAY